MSPKNKAEKRKAKLKARKQQIAFNEQSLSARLSCALEELCDPIMPEYIDDSNGPDLVGRRIVWRMGQIAWNIVVTGRRESVSEAFQHTQLNAEQQETVRNEIIGLIKRKFQTSQLSVQPSGIFLYCLSAVSLGSKYVRAIHSRKYRFQSLASRKANRRPFRMSLRMLFVPYAKG